MELVFEITATKRAVAPKLWFMHFDERGGVIGRAEACDWALPDELRHLSNRHACISCREGEFFITDISRNGIWELASGQRLPKGLAVPIKLATVYELGDYQVCAKLADATDEAACDLNCSSPSGDIIPDDAFLHDDPLTVLDPPEQAESQLPVAASLSSEVIVADTRPSADYALIATENLRVPQLVDAPAPVLASVLCEAPEDQREDFWKDFGAALQVDLSELGLQAREALALDAARLLNRCVHGLQQTLRTRSELKNELRLAQTTAQGLQQNPLKMAADTGDALGMLLRPKKPGQVPAEQSIAHAYRDVQAHQVALLTASRAAVRGTLEHFAPQQLSLRFERDRQPLLATSGSRWRAYERYHQALRLDDDWVERLLARDFAPAYEEQVRLISTLYTAPQG